MIGGAGGIRTKYVMTVIKKICQCCDKPFEVTSKSKSQSFCNIACYRQNQLDKKPKWRCNNCGIEFSHRDTRKFCCKSCAAKFNNMHRDSTIRDKQRQTLLDTLSKRPKKEKIVKVRRDMKERKIKLKSARKTKEIPGPLSKIYILRCKHSGELFVSRAFSKYSPRYRHLYSREGKAAYKFTFNIYDYPDLFDLSLINEHGWYSVGGKNSKPINKTGCSRDHRVSINDAIANGYDPFYIKHPLNCQLMLHRDNKMKHTRSSIPYAKLVESINAYEESKWRRARDSNP